MYPYLSTQLLYIGDFKRAEDHFRYAYDRAAKSQSALKKKYLFGAVVGLVFAAPANRHAGKVFLTSILLLFIYREWFLMLRKSTSWL